MPRVLKHLLEGVGEPEFNWQDSEKEVIIEHRSGFVQSWLAVSQAPGLVLSTLSSIRHILGATHTI
jgi:hypothetical protein